MKRTLWTVLPLGVVAAVTIWAATSEDKPPRSVTPKLPANAIPIGTVTKANAAAIVARHESPPIVLLAVPDGVKVRKFVPLVRTLAEDYPGILFVFGPMQAFRQKNADLFAFNTSWPGFVVSWLASNDSGEGLRQRIDATVSVPGLKELIVRAIAQIPNEPTEAPLDPWLALTGGRPR